MFKSLVILMCCSCALLINECLTDNKNDFEEKIRVSIKNNSLEIPTDDDDVDDDDASDNEEQEEERGLSLTKGSTTSVSSPIMNFMLVPALAIAGLVPWIVPGIRIAAGFAQMMNQMAFMAGLTSLIRSYIFDPRPDEHVVYINNGYGPNGHNINHPDD